MRLSACGTCPAGALAEAEQQTALQLGPIPENRPLKNRAPPTDFPITDKLQLITAASATTTLELSVLSNLKISGREAVDGFSVTCSLAPVTAEERSAASKIKASLHSEVLRLELTSSLQHPADQYQTLPRPPSMPILPTARQKRHQARAPQGDAKAP